MTPRTMPLRAASRAPGAAGFTLVEVTVSMLLLAIAALLFAGAITTRLTANAFARERELALHAAEAQLEPMISQPLQPLFSLPSLLLFNGSTFAVDGLTGQGGAQPGSITMDVSGVPLVTISVTVQWIGLSGPSQITLKTTVLLTGSLL